MDIFLQNTLTGEKEKFVPLVPGEVSMYNCGPTVYDYAHIGNLRSYVFADILHRTFEYNGYTVKQVINITDIGHLTSDGDEGEDKMTKALKREGKPMTLIAMREVANFYFGKFKEDLASLNIEMPAEFPFASDNIAEDIALVQKLTEKGFTYTTSDGIYFDTSRMPDYGKLGNIPKSDDEHSRIGINTEKKNSRDFALWKFNKELGYDADFGKGFPGWHIECTAMSVKYLGEKFDIHTGGIDHIPVHHNNEIAQAEGAGYPYAQVWMHNAFLNIPKLNLPIIRNFFGKKMAKSEENFITLQTLKEKGIDLMALRYFYLTAHYSTPMNFTLEALIGAQDSWKRLKTLSKSIFTSDTADNNSLEKNNVIINYYKDIFTQYSNNDLSTPQLLAIIQQLSKDTQISNQHKRNLILNFDKVLGLKLGDLEINVTENIKISDELQMFINRGNLSINTIEIPESVQKLINEINKARSEKNFAKSDEIRAQIEAFGYEVMDTSEGTKVIKR